MGGINGTTGALQATPYAANVGRASTMRGTIYAPNGTIYVERDSILTGALVARDVNVDQVGG